MERIVDNDTIRRYYDSQERVQIFLEHGEVVRCYIGRSMGPSKVWLMLKRRDSIGGHMVSPRDIRSMRGLGIYR